MNKKFKSIYLVCIEHQNDMNYVVARNPSLKKARLAVKEAKKQFPNEEIYITVEKILKENPSIIQSLGLGPTYTANLGSSKCVCGYKKGGCVSNLGCSCSAISLCKQMDADESPYLMLSSAPQIDELEEVEIDIVRISRNLVEVLIPDWADNSIGLSINEFPRDVLRELAPGVVITAMINIDAESENDLILRDIKIAYENEENYDEDRPDDQELDDGGDDYEFESDEEGDYEFEDEDDDYELDKDTPNELLQTSNPTLSWSQLTEKALDVEKQEDELEDDGYLTNNLLK